MHLVRQGLPVIPLSLFASLPCTFVSMTLRTKKYWYTYSFNLQDQLAPSSVFVIFRNEAAYIIHCVGCIKLTRFTCIPYGRVRPLFHFHFHYTCNILLCGRLSKEELLIHLLKLWNPLAPFMLWLAWSCETELHKHSTVLDALRRRNPELLYVVSCCITFGHGVWARGKKPD